MIKLIASDLDGTLLRNGAQELNPEVFQLIHTLKELGVLFVAASGRQYPNMSRLFEPVKKDMIFICENGSLTVCREKVMNKETFQRELEREILHSIWEKDTAEYLYSGVKTCYITPKDPRYGYHMQHVVKNQVTIVENPDCIQEPAIKISVFEEAGIDAIEGYWQERFGDRATVVTSGFEWLDFMPYGTNKGKALLKLQRQLRILPEECMAFGDQQNDIEMLRSVQYSYAMDTARDCVKAVSRGETDCVEDVLRKVIAEKKNLEEGKQ